MATFDVISIWLIILMLWEWSSWTPIILAILFFDISGRRARPNEMFCGFWLFETVKDTQSFLQVWVIFDLRLLEAMVSSTLIRNAQTLWWMTQMTNNDGIITLNVITGQGLLRTPGSLTHGQGMECVIEFPFSQLRLLVLCCSFGLCRLYSDSYSTINLLSSWHTWTIQYKAADLYVLNLVNSYLLLEKGLLI